MTEQPEPVNTPLLCRLGWHRWRSTTWAEDRCGRPYFILARCARCNQECILDGREPWEVR